MNDFHARLVKAAAAGALILTANKRLARHLRCAFDSAMQGLGKTVWPTPLMVSLDGWLSRSLAALDESRHLLDGFPALRLWEQLIEEESAGSELELLQLSATARKAQEAHQLLSAYRCRLEGRALTEDQRVFQQWRRRYQERCRQQQWLDRADLPELIFAAIREGRLAVPRQVLLAGFDQWSPVLQGLREAVEQQGGQLLDIQPEAQPAAAVQRLACSDARQEIEQAARWARQLLEQGVAAIGVVVPDLQMRRQRIERVFRDQIDPAASVALGEDESAFSLSLGAPLKELGPIHAALEILGAGFRLSIDQAGFLLRTPYLGGSQSEADQRAKLDVWLRSFRRQGIAFKRLAELAAQEQRAVAVAACFQPLLKGLADSSRRLPGEWAGQFDRLLQEVGWPGERSLSSSEYQMVKAWRDKLLPALASLDPVSRPIDRRRALGLLRRLAGEIEFQTEAATGPVQVVGLLESAGLAFDHLWVMGMSEETLPAPPRPNPFLPIDLQLQHGMPHAGADRELDFARRVVSRLKAASPNLLFSYPLRDGDCELRPSPLIADLAAAEAPRFAAHDPLRRLQSSAPPLLEETDCRGPRLASERGEGGTGILKDQALCPFRAFAHYRLRGHEFEQAQPGLDAMTRGDLLHRSLEHFWSDVREQRQLLALDADERAARIERHIATALEEFFAGQVQPPPALLQLEQARLQGLVQEWLTVVEADREPFAVLELEQEHYEQIGPLQIRTVVDRIDQLPDGSRVILDYKTGLVSADGLLGARLLEPQLPIYAVAAAGSEADAVAFAQVRRGACKLVGIAREDGLLPRVPGVAASKALQELGLENWSQLREHWRRQLEQLAADYVNGEASVNPVSYEKACQFCDLAGLCRIAEARYETAAGEVSA